MGDELKVKDVFTKVYRNCPQDKSALIRLIMQVHTNQNIYNKKKIKISIVKMITRLNTKIFC